MMGSYSEAEDVLRYEMRKCPVCHKEFYARKISDRNICRSCELKIIKGGEME